MNNYFINNAIKCCNEFRNLLKSNKYISKKIFDSFLDSYNDTFLYINKNNLKINENIDNYLKSINNNGYTIIDKRNQKFVEQKLLENEEYFNNMFKNIDENISLDMEQRKAIVIDEDYSLVIAGAGSGKTTTMVAKVKYLIDKCNVDPKKIILLSFSKKAQQELSIMVNDYFKLNIEVKTFHKLGMDFIREIYNTNKPIGIVKEATLHNLIKEFLLNYLFKNKKELKEFMEAFDDYLTFDEKILEFNDYEDYFKYCADKKYEQLKDDLDKYIYRTIKRRTKNKKTINGEIVRSIGEVRIANYLYKKGYNYKYEKVYPHNTETNHSYSPDFTVFNGELETYIEYYGMTTYSENGKFSLDEINAYNKVIEKKQFLHQKYGTDLIEIYDKYEDNRNYIDELEKKLSRRNIKVTEKTNKEIFYRLFYTNRETQYFNFINLCADFINKFKEKGYTLDNFNDLILKETSIKQQNQLKFIRLFYIYYNKVIHSNYKIDFNDMINYAYQKLDVVKEKNKYLDYDYIIIDEYQDISMQRYNLAKKLSDIFNAKIVAVGDDWQAIFGFSGADINLFTKFYNFMGYAEIIKITNTYRNSQELIDIAGEFVSKNEEQFNKRLISKKHLEKPLEICYYDTNILNSEVDLLEKIIGKLYFENREQKILILGRYNDDIEVYLNSGKFSELTNDKIMSLKYPQAKLTFMTIHSSKGLGYDQVIIINAINDIHGFPSQVQDEPLIDLLNEKIKEPIEFPEERRLFYVALTRTKNKVFILVPKTPFEKQSDFIKEIKRNKNVSEVW